MAEPTDAQITAQHTRLGFPGLDKFYVHIRRWAPTQQLEVPTKARVREIIAKRSTPQVFAQPKSSKGHHVSLGPSMFQADLASFQAVGAGSRNQGYLWVYCLISVWNRKLWTRAQKDKLPGTTRDSLQSILDNDMTAAERASVRDITSDAGNEMTGVYSQLLEARGIGQRIKGDSRQGTAIIDRCISSWKKAMYADMQQRNSTIWYNRVEQVTKGYNERLHDSLGAAPDDVAGNSWLEHLLLQKNTRLAEDNAKQWARTKRDLEVGSRFRALLPQKTRGFRRAYRPVYSRQVYTVASFRERGRKIVATDGSVHSTARVLAVPQGSTNTSFQALDYAERERRQQVRAARGGGDE